MRITEFRTCWAVVGDDGHHLGIIKEVGHHYLLISRSLIGAHLHVPVSSIANVQHETIHRDITRDDALQMGWERPPRHDELEDGPDDLLVTPDTGGRGIQPALPRSARPEPG
jgi:hypothetical protein